MPIRRAKTLTFKAKGLTDAVDATNAFPGSMQILEDLIPSPTTAQQWVPRPASISVVNFSPGIITDTSGADITDTSGADIEDTSSFFDGAMQIEALYQVGTRLYGMVATDRYAGRSEPFCYDQALGAFISIANVTAANTPTTQPTTGDWTPPTMDMIANRIMITHPGYDGVTNFIGWIDLQNFTSSDLTGAYDNSDEITVSADALQAGWTVGQSISGFDIPAGAYIANISSDGLTVTISEVTTGGSHSGEALTVAGGTTAAPLYGAGNTAVEPLVAVPVSVSQYNGRAYYAVMNGLVFSDPLQPTNVTGDGGTVDPVLTMGDSTPVTALAGVPLLSTVVGGTVQSLIAFKGAEPYYQVTGDPTTSNLASNLVEGSVGTFAPNTLASTPQGIIYAAPDGIRIIGQTGLCSQPLGANGQGVSVPFQYAINPSRMAGAYNQNVYRISVQNGFVNEQPNQEYWYDFNLGVWSGPHSFPAALIVPVYKPTNGFVLAGVGLDAQLWYSTAFPTSGSTYVENGVQLVPAWQPTLLPDNGVMAKNSSPQGVLGMALPAGAQVTVLALDELGNVIDSVVIAGVGGAGSIWDSFDWGGAVWGSSITPYQEYNLPWSEPLVFKQATLRATCAAQSGFAIGNAYLQYQELGYVGAAA